MPQLSEAVKEDHARVRKAYHQLMNARPEERTDPSYFIWALDRYLIVEDLVLTPALNNHVERGGERQRRLSADYDSVSVPFLLASRISANAEETDERKAATHAEILPRRAEL